MSQIFQYPRGFQSPTPDRWRFLTPPSYTGLIKRSNPVSLATALEACLSRFSSERDLGAAGRVRVDLSRDGTRQVVTGRRIWSTSIFPSRKCGAPIVCEGGNELLLATHCEIDPGVIGFATQALCFEVAVEGRWQKYHADFVRLLADGTIEVVEVKPNAQHLLKPGYQAKLEAVKEICRRLGWNFRLAFGEDLRRRTFFNFHAEQMYRHRFYRIVPKVEDAILTRVWSQKVGLALGDLRQFFDHHAEWVAAIGQLICRAELYVDLSVPLVHDTQVVAVDRRAA